MKNVVLLFLVLICFGVQAQEVVLERNPAVDTTKDKTGPNRKHFLHVFASGGLVTGPKNTNARLKYFGNYNLQLGLRYKLRFNDFYAIGFETSVTNMTCNLRQEEGKWLPDTILHKKERLNWMYLNLSFFNRINFYKRGDILGNYLDLGITGSYCPSFVHFTMDKTPDGRTLRTRERGLPYFSPFAYSVFGRVGFNRFAVSISYRLSNLFKPGYQYANIAPVWATIEVALY